MILLYISVEFIGNFIFKEYLLDINITNVFVGIRSLCSLALRKILVYVKKQCYDLRRDYMDIEAFQCTQMAKSILWIMIGSWSSEWVY